jgi:hypothetical protein
MPLGVIGTDHVGYGSFDLSLLRQIEVLQSIKMALDAAKAMGSRHATTCGGIFTNPGRAFQESRHHPRRP